MPTHATAAVGGESWLQAAKRAFGRLCGDLAAAFRDVVAKRLLTPTHLLALLTDARFKRLKMLSEMERTHAFHLAKRRLQTICLTSALGGADGAKAPTPDAAPSPSQSRSQTAGSSIEHPLAEFCEEHPVAAASASAASASSAAAAAHAAETALMEYLSALPPLSIDADVHQFWALAAPLAPANSPAAGSASVSWATAAAHGDSSERHMCLVRALAAEVLCVPAMCRSCAGDWHSECAPLKNGMESASQKQMTAPEIVALTEKLLYLQSNQNLIRL